MDPDPDCFADPDPDTGKNTLKVDFIKKLLRIKKLFGKTKLVLTIFLGGYTF